MPAPLRIAVLLAAGGLLAAAGFALVGPERLWSLVGGPADQGPTPLAGLSRRSVPNDALAASPGLVEARIDLALPDYASSPEALAAAVDRVVASLGRTTRVDDGARPLYRRYVARTPVLGFPDTLEATVVARGDGGSGLVLYSRSLIGRGDAGTNLRRLRAVVAALGR